MSTTLKSHRLPFAESLLARGRTLKHHGFLRQAARLLRRLLAIRDLSHDVAQETRRLLAEIALNCRECKRARRHLSAALACDPNDADLHYLFAVAIQDDPDADAERAARHYRRALARDSRNPIYLSEFGQYLVERGHVDKGIRLLRRAWKIAPDDPETVGALAQALRQSGDSATAERIVRLAMFRNNHDRRFRELWTKHQFDVLHARQVWERQKTRQLDEPVLLPLVRAAQASQSADGKTIRVDGPSTLPGPKRPVRRNYSGRRSAT